jgi:cell wall-associated NlpC family hydrolase
MAGNTQGTPGLGAIQRAAKANGIDWRAPAAIAYHESHLNPAAVGDNGTSFGFFQLHQGGALPAGTPISQATNPDWNANFAARAIKALGIQGLPVNQQIYQISKRFERPTNVAGEVSDAQNYYRTTLAGLGAGQRATPPAATGQTPAAPLSPPTQTTQSLAPLQASLALGQAQNQRALDALGKISGVKSTAAAAPDLSTLISNSATNVVAPTKPTHTVSINPAHPTPTHIDPQAQKVVELAKHYLGSKYVFGGASPKSGFDCSGLAQWSYGQLGIKIPRTAAEQFQAARKVGANQLKPGDLVFFSNTDGPGVTHVGIYAGGPNRSFVQAPHTGDVVKVSSLNDPYYQDHFTAGGTFT